MSDSRLYKIVFCTPALYSAGGVERVVSIKANYFAEHFGYEVTIIVTEGKDFPPFFPISEKVQVINLGINFEQLWHTSLVRKIILYLKKQRLYKKQLRDELLRIRPDVTISTLRREINFLTKVNDGSVKIGELHLNRDSYRVIDYGKSWFIPRLFTKWWKKELISHLSHLDKFIVLTELSTKEWPELDNVVMIPDPLPIHTCSASLLNTKRVVTIGRYSYEKGYDLLLRAWAIVEKQVPDWHLDIYGMGYADPYRVIASDIGLDMERCHIMGSVDDVQNIYQNSSIFVLSSRFEGFGLVLLEAMANGVPVVSFACPNGPLELISDGVNGLLALPKDIDSLAEKLVLLINNSDLRQKLAINGLQKSRMYSIDVIANRWKLLFDELMQGR